MTRSEGGEGPLPFLKAAVEALGRGEARQALALASEACWSAPKLPEAHYVYGQAWLALGEVARADEAFSAAVRLKAGWADAWINLGLTRYRLGRLEEAKAAMRQALTRAPGHPAATANLAAFMRITGESEDAADLLRKALDRDPGNAAARLNLAADLLQLERGQEAITLLREAEPPADDPDLARHWRLQSSLALLQLRRFRASDHGPFRPRQVLVRLRRARPRLRLLAPRPRASRPIPAVLALRARVVHRRQHRGVRRGANGQGAAGEQSGRCAGFHCRHAALRHDIVRADPGGAP